MAAQVLFFNVFTEKDPHLNAVEGFKKRCRSNYRSAMQHQPRKQHQPRLQHFQQNKFWKKGFTRLKNYSNLVR